MVGNNTIVAARLAKKTGKSTEYYQDILNFIFKEVRHAMENEVAAGIYLRGIGTWRIDNAKMRLLIYRTIRMIRKCRAINDTKHKNLLPKELEKLRYLLKMRDLLAKHYTKKVEYNDEKYIRKTEKRKKYWERVDKVRAEYTIRPESEENGNMQQMPIQDQNTEC